MVALGVEAMHELQRDGGGAVGGGVGGAVGGGQGGGVGGGVGGRAPTARL